MQEGLEGGKETETHEEELVGGEIVIHCVKQAVVAEESLEIEAVLGMPLYPA
jgi:hypothetical protein